MSAKKEILSELVAARNTIKNKFKKAYTDRINRERGIKEVILFFLDFFLFKTNILIKFIL